ncbi:MAG: fumarylacetoacetate hydrolase family protein [Pseudomonadota bacterium]
MKLIRYGQPGQEKPGVLDADGRVRDVSALLPDFSPSTIGTPAFAQLLASKPEDYPLAPEGARLGAPIGGTRLIAAVGLNYADHAAEASMALPAEPAVFMKSVHSICGPNDDTLFPPGSEKLDWEAELGIVIGRTARHVGEADALSYVLGYCVVNDVSERSFQLERGGTWDKGKSYDSFTPLGPFLVTPDEVGDPGALDVWCKVNGETMQQGSTANMVFGPAALISYISQFMTLHPGDLITTGTPAGVGYGKKPQRFLRVGDVVTLGISGLGSQRQVVTKQG